MSKKESSKSIIGENSFFQGKFYIPGELQVDGKFDGTSLSCDNLIVNKKGKIKSNVKINNATIAGMVIGNITAKNSLVLLSTAKVLGHIKVPELVLQNGVVFEGKCSILQDNKKSAQSLINKLYEEKA